MKVLTIGSAMIDTIAIIGSARIERMTMLNAESSFLLLEEGRKTEPRRCLRTPEAARSMLRCPWPALEWMLRCLQSSVQMSARTRFCGISNRKVSPPRG